MTSEPQGYYATGAGQPQRFPRVSNTIKTDACVIGGGYTGLCAALALAKAGARVALVEAATIGFAASGRNGGQIHSGHRKDQATLEHWLGREHARSLWSLAEEAKARVRALISDHAIACDLRSGLIIAAHDAAALRVLAAEHDHLRSEYGQHDAKMLDAEEAHAVLGTRIYRGARLDPGGGHLHPLKFAFGLAGAAAAAGAMIYEHSAAVAIERDKRPLVVACAQGRVEADHVVVACDAFSGEILPELAPYIGHVESFITATAPLPPELARAILPSDAAVADTRHILDYYRKSADRRLLFAGRESYFSIPKDIAGLVRPRMLRVFPQLAGVPTEFAWSGTVGITRTRMPHFGRLGDRILFAHGYSGHGVALATLGGSVLAEAVLGQVERFDAMARVPAQPFPGGPALRKPLVTAALVWFKVLDAL